jgi:hypothetical protein
MTKEEKLKELINHVEKLGLKYSKTKFPEQHTCHLFVLPYRIAVHLCGINDDEFRKKYKKRIFIHNEDSVEDIIRNFDELKGKLDWAYEHREEIREKKRQNLQYAQECWQRHLDRLARREAHEKKMAEIKAKKEAEKPKRKRHRIVRYEKVSIIK